MLSEIYCSENYILLKAQGGGDKNIISNDFSSNLPSKAQINDVTINSPTRVQSLAPGLNTIKLIWDSQIETTKNMFKSLTHIISIDCTHFDFREVTTMYSFFEGCTSLLSIDLSGADAKRVNEMKYMFKNCRSLISLNLTNFQTHAIFDMNSMFEQCNSIVSIDLSSFTTPALVAMGDMFYNCSKLEYVDLSSFDTSIVQYMNRVFGDCHSIKSIDLSAFRTPKLIRMYDMFSNCYSLESLAISSFNTANVDDMHSLFKNCRSLKSLDLRNFNTAKVKNMNSMFNGCTILESLDISSFDTSSAVKMESMFRSCKALESLNLNNFQASNLETMNSMFKDCDILKSIDLSNFITSKVKDMTSAFESCIALESINLGSFDTSSLVNMNYMFSNCILLKSLNLINFETPNLENIKELFSGCESLESVDIRKLNTAKVKDMSSIFYNCKALKSLDINNFETGLVTTMSKMFEGCNQLSSLYVNHFNTESLTNMEKMFYQCQSLTSLDLSNFKTNNVNKVDNMFQNCDSLEYLDVSNFNTEQINNMNNLFSYTGSLKFLNLSSFTIYITTTIEDIFKETNPQIILCYNESKMPDHFLVKALYYENCCRDLCIMKNKKFILEIEMCVDNCYSENDYKYEFNDICYKECPAKIQRKIDSAYLCEDCPVYYDYEQIRCITIVPEGYYNNDTSAKTIDKCPIKCKTCSYNSIQNGNLCTLCKIDSYYYPKSDERLNENSFYECYHKDEEQTGYYLDNNIFKPCNEKCKTCSLVSIQNGNLCTLCNIDENYYPKSDESLNNDYYECYKGEQAGYYLDNNIFKPCDDKCKTCSFDSIQNGNLCTSCNIEDNYYPKSDESLNNDYYECYKGEQTGYYLDNNIYKPCNEKCKTCSLDSIQDNNLCTLCNIDDNYYPKSDESLNNDYYECYKGEQIGYYLDNNIFKKCDEKCKTCTLESLEAHNLCTSCNINNFYYPKYNDPVNENLFYECYHKNNEQVGYYLDTDNNIFKPCNEKCKTCSLDSINNNNLCTLCNIDDNYHPKSDESLNDPYYECYKGEQTGYYLDTDNIYKPCNEKCKTCSLDSIQENNLCTSCNIDDYYYPKLDESLNNLYYECYFKNDEQNGYYLDTDNNIFKKCDEKCKTCSYESIQNHNLCTLCNFDAYYYPKSDDPLNENSFYECYNKNEEQIGYY